MYFNKFFPFFDYSDFVRSYSETVPVSEIYLPFTLTGSSVVKPVSRPLNAYRILPSDILVLNEPDSICYDVANGVYGGSLVLNITELDYFQVAFNVDVSEVDGLLSATYYINGGYEKEDILTDVFINSSANGVRVSNTDSSLKDVVYEYTPGVNMYDWMDSDSVIQEASLFNQLKDKVSDIPGYGEIKVDTDAKSDDPTYAYLDNYFSLPEGEELKSGGREVVPLLIGPTAVFKSATVKELCKKYDYRLVDFRVSFTSRLDFSGLFQIGEVDGKKYSYSCPMEELVTCSDGFREYCRKAYDKVSKILTDGYTIENVKGSGDNKVGDRVPITEEQRSGLESLLEKYKEYMKTPVLFFDEINRTNDKGIEGILVTLLNQKKFNDMNMSGCKFIAACNLNLNLDSRHEDLKDDLDMLYQVNSDLDSAFLNRFIPIKVYPKDVQGRWFEWAKGTKVLNGKNVPNIHACVVDFLSSHNDLVYNDSPVLDAIEMGKEDTEISSQTFPNYRTWEMVSDYLYSVDEAAELGNPKIVRRTIISGLISDNVADKFIDYLTGLGYEEFVKSEDTDDISDFLSSTLDSGVPALMISPSSMGKTSRVKSYMKKVEERTGTKPVLINISLASKDAVDLMGYPIKEDLTDYVSGGILNKIKIPSLGNDLKGIMESVSSDLSYGMTDKLTVRAPDMEIKKRFKKALDEGREVILFFDEINRCQTTTVMSAVFQCISDSVFAGISFKDQKDKVKIVAACNMRHSEMDDDSIDIYSSANSLDPALANRFALYWKKKYDANDVHSWINFMEEQKSEGNIDGTVLDFFKTLSDEEAIEVMSSVEKRVMENAEPSTRMLLQLSKDIKAMRQASKTGRTTGLFAGAVFFNDMVRDEYSSIIQSYSNFLDQGIDLNSSCEYFSKFCKKLINFRNFWEPVKTGRTVEVKGVTLSGEDIIDSLEDCCKVLTDYAVRPITSEEIGDCMKALSTTIYLLDAASEMDTSISDMRVKQFTNFVGEDFANRFIGYFNSVFGTDMDTDITVEMLSDDSLISPFLDVFNINLSKYSGNTEKIISKYVDLVGEFWRVHKDTLPAENYADLLDGIKSRLPNTDNFITFLNTMPKVYEGVFVGAEAKGTSWIERYLENYTKPITSDEIKRIQNISKTSVSNNSDIRLL